MTRSILIALTSHRELGDTGRETGFFVGEAAHPWKVFTDAGYMVDLVSIAGGVPPQDGLDADDPVQKEFLADERVAAQLAATRSLADVDPADYDAILLAGGHGTMWDFPDDTRLAGLARAVYESGGVVSAVCHGPSGLVNATLSDGTPLVAGKRVWRSPTRRSRRSGWPTSSRSCSRPGWRSAAPRTAAPRPSPRTSSATAAS